MRNLKNDWELKDRTISLHTVAEVARSLKHLKDKMVFVGGAVVSLYTDDPAADEIRPTSDIDLTVMLMSYGEWVQMQEELASLDIFPDPAGPSIFRYKLRDIPLDIIPFQDSSLGPSNRWYALGMNDLLNIEVHGEQIQIFPPPCFLATKFEAFNSRGRDYRTSHDIEDIVYVLDNRATIAEEIIDASTEIRSFIKDSIRKILDRGLLDEVLTAHINPLMLGERLPLLQEKIDRILTESA